MLATQPAPAQTDMGLAPITALPAAGVDAPMPLLLQTFINGNPIPGLLPYSQRNGALWADLDTLRRIGLRNVHEASKLDTLPGVSSSYDAATQQIWLHAPVDQLNLAATVVDAGRPQSIQASTGTGLLLNYDLYGIHDPGYASTLNAATELRAFSNYGVLSNTMLTTMRRQTAAFAGEQASHVHNVRMDTAWSSYWPGSAIRLTLGDMTSSNLSWSRSLRMGGIQIGRDYSLQPYRIITPLPAFMGTATVPSAVDLYINGFRRYQGDLPAGPFQLDNMPTVSGLGNARMVLTDALGRQTQFSIPFYASTNLLAPGLADWGLEAGFVRRRYGYSSFTYASDPVFSGTLRYGLNRHITLEAHAEATRAVKMAGVGATTSIGLLGQVSGSISASKAGTLQGHQFSVGYQWQGQRFHVALNTLRTSKSYRDAAAIEDGQLPTRVSESAVAGINLGRLGSLNANYVRARYAAPWGGNAYSNQLVSKYAGVSWSKSLGSRALINISYNRSLAEPRDNIVFVGLSLYLDNNLNLGTTLQRRNGASTVGASASQWTQAATGWNWSLQGQRGPQSRNANAEASYRSRYGDFKAGISEADNHEWAYGGASGAVVFMNGAAFAGRHVDDGFAVVSTSGVPGVPVRLHSRPVGKTDAQGMLMVSPLGAYQKNLISIDPLDLPADMKIEQVEAEVAPQRQSGTLVNFRLEAVRAATIVLHNPAGQPLPVGARLLVNDHEAATSVGYDGMAYVENLKDENTVRVEYFAADGIPTQAGGASATQTAMVSCSVTFSYANRSVTGAPVGPLTCK